MTLYAQYSFQIWPSEPVIAERVTSTGTDDHWLKFDHEGHVFSQFLIVGATAEEIDAIVMAINAPIMRVRGELETAVEAKQAVE